MLYLALGLALSLGALLELQREERRPSPGFWLLAGVMLAMICFRYGQGTDYLFYEMKYHRISPDANLLVNTLDHGELGWFVIMALFRRVGAGFPLCMGAVALFTMGGLYRAIVRHSPLRIFSLLLLYPTYYLTYGFSAVRQGLVLGIFLGWGLEALEKKHYVRYLLGVGISFFFHKSALLLLLLPLVSRRDSGGYGSKIVGGMLLIMGMGYTGILGRIAALLGVSVYMEVSISVPAILLRLLIGGCVSRMHAAISRYGEDPEEVFFYNLYMTGLLLFTGLSFAATLSQRLTMPLKAIEVLLIPMQLDRLRVLRRQGVETGVFRVHWNGRSVFVIPLLLIAVMGVELVKNLDSYLEQGYYYETVHVTNYPYVTAFDQDTLWQYRERPKDLNPT